MKDRFRQPLVILGASLLGVLSLQQIALAQPTFRGPTWLLSSTAIAQEAPETSPPPQASNTPPVVDGTTWATEENIPWSQLVLIRDSHGEHLGVIDRDYPSGFSVKELRQTGLLTQWSREQVEMYGYHTHRRCVFILFVPVCKTSHPLSQIDSAQIKIGSQIYDLQGGPSRFAINNTLARALKTAESGQVLIRFSPRNSGDIITRQVGDNTITAWKTLYRDASPFALETEPKPHPVPSFSQPSGEWPVVDGATWRLKDDIPWSVPVLVQDAFDGNYMAVLDAEFSGGPSGLKTNWSRQTVWFHIYRMGDGVYETEEVNEADLKIGDRTFHLTGRHNQFAISEELAKALREAPTGQVSISFTSRKGEYLTHNVGDNTLKAWKTVYALEPQPTPAP